MLTVLEIIKKTTDFLGTKGIESPRLNAELLMGHALGLKRMQLYLQFERPLPEADLEKIRPLVRRRAQHEPVQYILGETEFYGLKLKADRRALIPRPETELLIEKVVAAVAPNPTRGEDTPAPAGAGVSSPRPAPERILDLGTGTGAIALALATVFPTAAVTATDASADALALARENTEALGLAARVELREARWFDGLSAEPGYDLIVSNPPYLTAEETAQTRPEVRNFEPVSALTAAEDGLADLRAIIAGAPAYLRPGGLLALETGIAQHPRLLELLAAAGFSRTESHQDLTGRDRFVMAWK